MELPLEIDELDDFFEDMRREAKDQIQMLVKARRLSTEDAVARHIESLRIIYRRSPEDFAIASRATMEIHAEFNKERRRRQIINYSDGTATADEMKLSPWYLGAQAGDIFWPRLSKSLRESTTQEISESVDKASEEVVAHLADPVREGLKKKGLVVGFVQSGKTANYTAVISKALDRGYRLIIVLSGIHNNLRKQTQLRLNADLGLNEAGIEGSVHPLTSSERDFEEGVTPGHALFERDVPMIAVVKKNTLRLQYVNSWLGEVHEKSRRKLPILIIDDEADQATPNTQAEMDKISVINGLLRDLWKKVESGTYLGYTATPFANVFMDPDDDDELFPSDFIVALRRPEEYFGAEQVFGKAIPEDAECPDNGLDMVRLVSDPEAQGLRPPHKKESRIDFDFTLPQTLKSAVRWFIIATAIRRSRGQAGKHSSMLVHTTHYSEQHFQMQSKLKNLITSLKLELEQIGDQDFQKQFDAEIDRAAHTWGGVRTAWHDVSQFLEPVLSDLEVIVDNSRKEAERINYAQEDENGDMIPQTAIVVGGGTLSRGLTLEGLVVSYFIRTSSMYDTLLQMGRWFGYRNGYADLPRIWTQRQLVLDFQFLAQVEADLRAEISLLSRLRKSPSEVGVRIRQHPGRLQITARNKLVHSDQVRLSLSGQRLQTFVLDEGGSQTRRNLAATRHFLANISDYRQFDLLKSNVFASYRNVPADSMIDFIGSYGIHDDLAGMNREDITKWIKERAIDLPWNVVVMKGPSEERVFAGKTYNLGSVDLGLEAGVVTINRAPLGDVKEKANIKALMSAPDILLDIETKFKKESKSVKFADYLGHRRKNAQNRGLLVVYPISRYSTPTTVEEESQSRRQMQSDEHLIGLGFVFPTVSGAASEQDGDFVSVRPDWNIASSEIAELDTDESN